MKKEKIYKAIWIDEKIMKKIKLKLKHGESLSNLAESIFLKHYLNETKKTKKAL